MNAFQVRNYRIPVNKKSRGEATIVLLCDLHGACYGENHRELIDAIDAQRPDLIVSAGDLIMDADRPRIDNVLALLAQLAARYPVYCGNGNHETKLRQREGGRLYRELAAGIRACGAHLLTNERRKLTAGGIPMEIAGLEIGLKHFRRVGASRLTLPEMCGYLQRPEKEVFSLLIAHNPMDFPVYAAWGADLVVSGHLHGGCVRLPLLGGVVSPQLRLFPKYDRGEFALGKSCMVVGAGLGEHGIGIRLGNPRELPVIKLVQSKR